jgi:lipopolysaccharide export system protein LptA
MSDRPRLCTCARLGPVLARSALAVALAAALTVAAPPPAAADTDQFSFSAEQMETVLAEGRERTVLTGSAALTSDDTEIFAERIELYGDDLSFALSQGGVRVVQVGAGIELTSETVFYNRRDGIVRVEGDALLIDHDNEMVIKGGFLEHWEERDETSIQIGVQILSDDLVARAQLVHYDRRAQTLALSGLPVVTWKGDEYRASRIFIDLDQDRIVLSGAVSGQITPSSEDDADAEEGAGEEPDATAPDAMDRPTDEAGAGEVAPTTPADGGADG